MREYILDHPEILPEAMDRLHQREEGRGGKQAARHRAALFGGVDGQCEGRRHRRRLPRL
ncbi:MAG: hypothetical protein WDN24_22420 [Sphingomonas sp.]